MGPRFKQFIKHVGLTAEELAKLIGCSRATVFNYYKDLSNLSMGELEILLREYPRLNFDWLLLGEGPMLRSEGIENPTAIYQSANGHGNSQVAQIVESQLESCQREVELLRAAVKDKERLIQVLMEKKG